MSIVRKRVLGFRLLYYVGWCCRTFAKSVSIRWTSIISSSHELLLKWRPNATVRSKLLKISLVKVCESLVWGDAFSAHIPCDATNWQQNFPKKNPIKRRLLFLNASLFTEEVCPPPDSRLPHMFQSTVQLSTNRRQLQAPCYSEHND